MRVSRDRRRVEVQVGHLAVWEEVVEEEWFDRWREVVAEELIAVKECCLLLDRVGQSVCFEQRCLIMKRTIGSWCDCHIYPLAALNYRDKQVKIGPHCVRRF